MDRRHRLLGALALALLGTPACDEESCTTAGCDPSPVAVVLLGPNWGPLAPGSYAVSLELDAASLSVSCTTGETQACDAVEGDAPFEVEAIVSTSDRISLNVRSDDPDVLPDGYAVAVSNEQGLLVEESGEFTYRESQPNGPGCAPICRESDGAFVFVEG